MNTVQEAWHFPSLVKLYAVLCTHCTWGADGRVQLFTQALGDARAHLEATEEGYIGTPVLGLGEGSRAPVARGSGHLSLSQLTQES